MEGWAGAPPPDDAESGESDMHEPPSSVEEEVPEILGCEWRVLHPFELPGVRHPTDILLHPMKGGWHRMMPW